MDLFYHVSKFLWGFAAPSNFLVIWLVLGAVLYFTTQAGRRACIGRFMLLSGLSFAVIVMVFPIGSWGLSLLEERIPQPKELPAEVAGIIVIGGSESENVAAVRGTTYTSFPTMNRMLVFKMLADHYPKADLMYAGGTTRVQTHAQMRQADIAARVMEIMQGTERKVIYERESRTTFENARNAANIIGEKRKQPWILVTSATQMPRALGTFRQQGWNIIPMPTDYSSEGMWKPLYSIDFIKNLATFQTMTREIIGMIGYYAGGKSDELFPSVR